MVLIFERGWGGSSPPFRMLKFFVSHVHFWISFSSFYSFMWFRFASDWVVFAFLSSRLTVSYCWLPFTQPKVYFVVWLNQVIVITCCFLQFQTLIVLGNIVYYCLKPLKVNLLHIFSMFLF